MEARLLSTSGKESPSMTENEFSEAVEAAITVPSEQLRRKLFLESQAYVATHDKTDTVPTLRLARILVYFYTDFFFLN